jgi:predicted nuclease of predicted toxin-antitoxin system
VPAVRERATRSPDSRRVKIWVDAQLPPAIAQWLTATHGVDAIAVRDLGLRDAEDSRIFFAARQDGAAVMSKDSDFVDLVLRHGPPPQIVWITCGNTSNTRLQEILGAVWPDVVRLLASGEKLVEIGMPKGTVTNPP